MTKHDDISTTVEQPVCVLDPRLVNADTLPLMKDVGLSIFASACSKNRGAFVVQPPDGNTYGCLAFPPSVLEMAGITDDGNRKLREEQNSSSTSENNTSSVAHEPAPVFTVGNVEDILKHYKDGNLTSSDTVQLLDFLVANVYQSTPNVAVTPYACDVNGLVTLQCRENLEAKTKTPIRAVSLAGVFTPALWATGGQELTLDQASSFYSEHDFREMKKLGLNAVQIPIPVKMFSQDEHHKEAAAWRDLLLETLHQVRVNDLDVILLLDKAGSPPEDISQPVREAAAFAQDYNAKHASDTAAVIVALTLPALDVALLEAANHAAPDLNIWIPTNGGDFKRLDQYSSLASGASLELSHTATIADIASSTSQEDRAKLFYHESTACIARAPLEYSTCYQEMPVVVATGFDLAIDDCHLKGIADNFKDYGQCDRFNETVDSPWWKDHRYSFAARQLFAYEQGHGWVFATWKLYGSDPEAIGVLDFPAKMLAFQEVAAAGLIPSLFDLDQSITYPLNGSSPVGLACLNPPENDFVLGDATLAPTPAPPPDCGNGWWNFTTEKCDYWIPPTAAPTPPCPVCDNNTVMTEPLECPPVINYTEATVAPSWKEGPNHHRALAVKYFFSGALVSLLLSFLVVRLVGLSNKRRGYEQVPTNEVNGLNSNGQHYQDA